MKIGLNATCLNDRPSGAKQRFVGIYRELVRQMPDDEFVVFEPADCRVGSWFESAPNVSARRTPIPSEGRVGRFLAGLGYWRSALSKESLDIFEGFNMPLVADPNASNLMTLHDVRSLVPGRGRMERIMFKHVLTSATARADRIIVVSETVRAELLAVLPCAQTSVVYNGLDLAQFRAPPRTTVERACLSWGLPEQFLLAVGHFEPRKNYLRLIDALALLRDRGSAHALVIIGNDSGGKAVVEERARYLGLSKSVTLLSGLSDLDVRCAFHACSAFVFPSTYEGFGIPILEAMAADKPMVLSDIPVFREITQSQGLYFAPYNVEAIADAIEKVCTSTDVQNDLVQYGRKRIHHFTFANLAGQVRDVYRLLGPRSVKIDIDEEVSR